MCFREKNLSEFQSKDTVLLASILRILVSCGCRLLLTIFKGWEGGGGGSVISP